MQTLINEYGAGGTKVGSGRARANPVNFVFMTGHANRNNNVGEGCPKNQAAIINESAGRTATTALTTIQ